jgi:signal transduction histidine kinase
MPEGGRLIVRAELSRLEGAEAVAIDFADAGEGIAAEHLEKIWEPFFTTKAEGKGTGLGMAICRRIVEEHGGTIEIESEMGRGTTVRMLFPATANGLQGNSQ